MLNYVSLTSIKCRLQTELSNIAHGLHAPCDRIKGPIFGNRIDSNHDSKCKSGDA